MDLMTVFLLCAGSSLHMFTQFNKEFNVRSITRTSLKLSRMITIYEINTFLTFGLIQHFGLVFLIHVYYRSWIPFHSK